MKRKPRSRGVPPRHVLPTVTIAYYRNRAYDEIGVVVDHDIMALTLFYFDTQHGYELL